MSMEPGENRERPSIEEKAEKMAVSSEFLQSIIEEDRKEREISATRYFRLGAKRLCSKAIWKKIEDKLHVTENNEIASKLKIRRQEPPKLRKGALTLDMLVACLGEVGWDWSHLSPMPTIEERAIAGYQLAMGWIQNGTIDAKQQELIDSESLLCGMAILQDHELIVARRENRLSQLDWDALALRVIKYVAERTKCTPESLPHITGAKLQSIRKNWIRYINECYDLIPHRWLDGNS